MRDDIVPGRHSHDDIRRAERELRDLIQRELYTGSTTIPATGEPLGRNAEGCARRGLNLWRRFRTATTTN